MAEMRTATVEDLPTLVALGRLMHAEAPNMRFTVYDADRVERALRYAIEVSGFAVVHVADDGQIDGGMAGVVSPRWFSAERQFSDLALFVRPDKRGGLLAARLIKATVAWCEAQGLRPFDVQLGISTGIHPEQTGEFLERLNFERVGGIYRLKGF